MPTYAIVILITTLLLTGLIAWFFVSLVWGKPWSVNLLFMRTFLKFALKGPELLTLLGILERFGLHRHNAKLSDVSEAFQDKMFAFVSHDLRLLRSYPRSRQDRVTRLSAEIMEYFLDDIERSEQFRHHDYPLNQMFGIQSELPNFMLTIHPLVSKLEAGNYIKRLSMFGVKFDQVMEGLLLREAKGVLPPKFVIRRVLDEMTAFIATPARVNPLFTVFKEKLEKLNRLNTADRENLLSAVEKEITRTVFPAYQKLIAYFTKLEKKAGSDDGVWHLPEGDAYYAHCLRSSTTTGYSPDEIHAIGLQEVARIEGEMKAILERLGYREVMNPPRFLADLTREPRFLFTNDEAGRSAALVEYQRILDEIDASLDPHFGLRPKAGLKVERVPEFREKTSAGAYYQPADMSGSRPGVFFANLRDMNEVHKFGMKTLAYHEGIPGHHFQIAIAQGLKGLPFFRRLVPFTAYAEGWALYAEKLAREIGMYREDPYSELGYLDSELFRAVRLVVDTGLHHKRWTREQAIEYMENHSASAHESVVSEVERYIVMPGQACAYKMGEIKLVALRERARTELGEKFDLRAFHDLVLGNGSMPLSILEQVVEDHIAEAR